MLRFLQARRRKRALEELLVVLVGYSTSSNGRV